MKREKNIGAERRVQSAKGKGLRAEGKGQRAISEQPRPTGSSVREVTRGISTVFHIKKPSATETRFPAEGCISESQTIRACLLIRVFNN